MKVPSSNSKFLFLTLLGGSSVQNPPGSLLIFLGGGIFFKSYDLMRETVGHVLEKAASLDLS